MGTLKKQLRVFTNKRYYFRIKTYAYYRKDLWGLIHMRRSYKYKRVLYSIMKRKRKFYYVMLNKVYKGIKFNNKTYNYRGNLLFVKKRLKLFYGYLRDRTIGKLGALVKRKLGEVINYFYAILERRVDVVLFRSLYTLTVRMARRFVYMYSIRLNGTVIKNPAKLVFIGDYLTVDKFMINNFFFRYDYFPKNIKLFKKRNPFYRYLNLRLVQKAPFFESFRQYYLPYFVSDLAQRKMLRKEHFAYRYRKNKSGFLHTEMLQYFHRIPLLFFLFCKYFLQKYKKLDLNFDIYKYVNRLHRYILPEIRELEFGNWFFEQSKSEIDKNMYKFGLPLPSKAALKNFLGPRREDVDFQYWDDKLFSTYDELYKALLQDRYKQGSPYYPNSKPTQNEPSTKNSSSDMDKKSSMAKKPIANNKTKPKAPIKKNLKKKDFGSRRFHSGTKRIENNEYKRSRYLNKNISEVQKLAAYSKILEEQNELYKVILEKPYLRKHFKRSKKTRDTLQHLNIVWPVSFWNIFLHILYSVIRESLMIELHKAAFAKFAKIPTLVGMRGLKIRFKYLYNKLIPYLLDGVIGRPFTQTRLVYAKPKFFRYWSFSRSVYKFFNTLTNYYFIYKGYLAHLEVNYKTHMLVLTRTPTVCTTTYPYGENKEMFFDYFKRKAYF